MRQGDKRRVGGMENSAGDKAKNRKAARKN